MAHPIVRQASSKLGLIFFLLFALVPFGWMLTASLEPQTSLYRAHLSLLPTRSRLPTTGRCSQPTQSPVRTFRATS